MSRAGKKKRFIASLMALTLMAAMPGGMVAMDRVYAEEASGSSTEKVQLDAPTNLSWGPPDKIYISPASKYAPQWEGVNPSIEEDEEDYGTSLWEVEVYKDDQLFDTVRTGYPYYEFYWDSEGNKIYTDVLIKEHAIGMHSCILESGNYKFRVKAKAWWKDEFHQDSEWSEWSESISYVRPEKELGVVTDIVWDEEKAGVCHFTPLADSEYLDFYRGTVYRLRDETMDLERDIIYSHAIYYRESTGIVDMDVSDIISTYGEGQYYVTVQAFSDDIDTVAHGRVSAPSEILDTTMNAEKLSGLLNNANAADKSAVATTELLTSSADISAIQQAMQTDDTFRGQIQGLESRYVQEQNISVEPPVVSETAKEYVDPDQVSVVGAAFNAAQGKTVNLQVDVTPEEERVPVLSGYKKNVQLDIKLVSDNEEVHALDMPVSVTMPTPQGITLSRLVLLHHRADGVTEIIPFHVNGDGTITFTVTSFSTFVFAEESSGEESGEPEPSKPEPDNSEPGNPASNPGQCNNNKVSDWLAPLKGQITAAVPGTTVRVTKEQNIKTLSHEIMQMLVRRGDVSLEMEYTYQGTDYHILIPAGEAIDNDILWYGPLYLAAYFSDVDTVPDTADTSDITVTYIVQKGDTLSRIARYYHTTVARLAAVNPQIRNVNRIMTGQVINID